MAGPYRGQILFGTADAGWSETYYLPGASVTSAMSALQAINTARMAMSPAAVKCIGLRVVDVTTPRLAQLAAGTTAAGTWVADTVVATPDISIMVRMTSADFLTRSRHFLRGIGQSIILANDPVALNTAGAFTTAFNSWVTSVKANANLGVKTGPHAYTLKAIDTMTMYPFGVVRRAGRPFNLRHGRHVLV
jgi:hypothetical protein